MTKFTLTFPWRENDGRQGVVEINIEALHPADHYRDHYGDFEGEHVDYQQWERHARVYAYCARSLVAFIDATGLERSDAFSDALVNGDALPTGHDHTKLWRVPNAGSPIGWQSGQFLLTTEPYGKSIRRLKHGAGSTAGIATPCRYVSACGGQRATMVHG